MRIYLAGGMTVCNVEGRERTIHPVTEMESAF